MLMKIQGLEPHAGCNSRDGRWEGFSGGRGFLMDVIKSKGLVLLSYIKNQCPYEKGGEGAAVYLSSPAL